MEKFVYFLYGDAYERCITNAIKKSKNAFSFVPFKSNLVKKIHIIHNSRPLNRKRELPLKSLWFKRAFKGMTLSNDEKVYFLMYESFHLSYSRKFLEYLKKKYPKCKVCFVYLNPVTNLISGKVEKISDLLDGIITFNEKDSKLYNLMYAPEQPYKLPIYKDDSFPKSDVFFVGSEKGRLKKLLAIYEKLTSNGLICDFHIVGVPENKQKYKDNIVYNKIIPYSEVLKRVYATKCVLEVLQNNEDYVSIRTSEAIQYHRKLLTESKSVMKYDFYDPKIIQVISNIDGIDIDFIKEPVDERVFKKNTINNVDAFHDFLKSHV